MAYPVSDPVFASDTNFSSGPESGTPTKVDPGLSYMQQGLVPGLKFVGPYLNLLLNRLCSWITLYVKDLHNQVEFLNKAYTFTGIHTHTNDLVCNNPVTCVSTLDVTSGITGTSFVQATNFRINHASNEFSYLSARSRTVMVPVVVSSDNGAIQWSLDATNGTAFSSTSASTRHLKVPLSAYLPRGATLTSVRAGVQDSGSNAISMLVYQQAEDKATMGAPVLNQLGTTYTTGGGAAPTLATTGAFTHTIDKTSSTYWAFFTVPAGSDINYVRWVEVNYDDNGPRNG